jgi:hypothetical protein
MQQGAGPARLDARAVRVVAITGDMDVMNTPHRYRLALVTALVPVLLGAADPAAPRARLDLDGIWGFATDPGNQGEAEKWYEPGARLPAMPLPGYAADAKGTIRVPGIWDNQGYGTETPKVRHSFVGKGWYRREVEIPAGWAGRRLFLAVTGSSRYAKVWVGGRLAGEHVGYVSPAEFEVTDTVRPGGKAVIVIQVGSQQRWEVDALYGASALADYMDVPWGGIWGHVYLEARASTWLEDLQVQPDVPASRCLATATVRGEVSRYDQVMLEIFATDGTCLAKAAVERRAEAEAGQVAGLPVAFPDAALWTPDQPTLYTARLSLLRAGAVVDALESRFGMRQFTTDGYRLLLNGRRLMLRGYGDDHIYPEQMAMPSDKTVHLTRLRLIKAYGFNHVRHHSTLMPPEYYDACDEVGIISTAEFPIVYAPFLPGTGATWKQHVPPGTDPAPALETYRREWTAAIRQLRNHPSILCWVMGNELYDELPLRADFARIARELDPARFFLDSDGASPALLDPKNDRATAALCLIQFEEWIPPDPNKFRTSVPTKPVLSHEAGNYVAFSRPDLIDLFQHNVKPFWMTAGKAKLEQLGLLSEAERWAAASERLYLLCHKLNLEALRGNPYLSGYHWWLFQDYWTSSNGLVDHYFRPKTVTPEEVLMINREVVLLLDGLRRTYHAGERAELVLRVSNFSPAALSGRLRWEVSAGDASVVRRELPLAAAPQGEVVEAARLSVELPGVSAPVKLRIAAEVTAGALTYRNEWSAWLYPAEIRPAASAIPLFADELQMAQCQGWGVQPLPAAGERAARAVYVAGWLDPRLADALNRGASIVLLDGGAQLLPTRRLTFRTTWWKAGDALDRNHCGTFVYDHPVTRAMAPDAWCDAGWFDLIEGSAKSVLEKAPARPTVVIRALPSLAAVEDDALLYEVGVGQGTLIVSGLNHRPAKDRPENRWLVARLLDHAARLEAPAAKWPLSFLSPVEAAPEGCIPGFRRMLANDGEDDTWYSDREDNARVLICRQTKTGNRVRWETAVVPQDVAGERLTFAFVGGLGYGTEPQTAGLMLEIDGKDAVAFDLPEPSRWESADKSVELRFVARRTIGPDAFGLFQVTLPRARVTPGKPCQLGVYSLGQGSRRWFGLYPYTDVR